MQIIENIALITINETLFVQLISFLIFLFLINRIMFRPLRETMQERETHIDDVTLGIKNSTQELNDMDEQIQQKEAEAVKQASKRKNELEDDGTLHANEIMDKARQEIHGIKEETRQYIEKQISEARTELKSESEKVAALIIEKILDRRAA